MAFDPQRLAYAALFAYAAWHAIRLLIDTSNGLCRGNPFDLRETPVEHHREDDHDHTTKKP